MDSFPILTLATIVFALLPARASTHSSAASPPYRTVILTDIGGSDPDDHQSMVHLPLYADTLDIEGLIATRAPRVREIFKAIDLYAHDYPNLKTYSPNYPTPDALRAITKAGAAANNGPSGVHTATEGSDWIVQCARRDDPRPLYVLVWGGLDDLAQALHDAPDILPKLRVYFIGSPNKQGSVDAYNYIEQNFPKLWIIENNSTYRGWFNGGDQAGKWGNKEFVTRHIAGRGALGNFYAPLHSGVLKMGDTPSVAWLLHGVPTDPTQPGWGGQFVRIWDGRKTIFDHLPTNDTEQVETFGVNEFTIRMPDRYSARNKATLVLDTRQKVHGAIAGKFLRFRFAVRDTKAFTYKIESDFPGLDGFMGKFTSVLPPPSRTDQPSTVHPTWWGDDPDPALVDHDYWGAKSISQWRVDYLSDFTERMNRCLVPADKKSATAAPLSGKP